MVNKRILAVLVVLTLLASVIAGCSKGANNGANQETSGKTSNGTTTEVQDRTTDVVVVGAGGAGLTAALEVKNAGKDVILVEKMPIVGGNTIRATGGINAAGTTVQKELGIEDSVDLHYEDTMKGGYYKNDPVLVRTLAENAADAVEWLISIGADLSDVGRLAGASANRAHRPTGGAAVGSHIVQVLKENCEKENIEILLETKAKEIIYENNEVKGIVVEDKDGNEYKIFAKAVILATGGFGANSEMVTSINSNLEGFKTTNHPGATGDGIVMAQAIGADVVQMEEIQTHPTCVPSNGYMITEAVRGNGAILVNRDGKRFINELETRDVVSKAILEQEGGSAFLLFDQNVRESLKAIEEYVSMNLTTEGQTLEELAGKLGMNAENLAETINNYNGYVVSKNDAEFGREDMPRKLDKAPYYAIEVVPAVHHTMGGLKINENAQVINTEGNVIKGLYAAGEVTGGVHGGNRLGGNALADIIVFGRIAAKTAVSELE